MKYEITCTFYIKANVQLLRVRPVPPVALEKLDEGVEDESTERHQHSSHDGASADREGEAVWQGRDALEGRPEVAHHRRLHADPPRPGGSVHGERANFTGLVLGCIDADFCK